MAGLALAADDFVSINMADVASCCELLWRIQLGRRGLFRQMAGFPAMTDLVCVAVDRSSSTSSSACRLRRPELIFCRLRSWSISTAKASKARSDGREKLSRRLLSR
jgi:hypothetical protein